MFPMELDLTILREKSCMQLYTEQLIIVDMDDNGYLVGFFFFNLNPFIIVRVRFTSLNPRNFFFFFF